MSRRDDVASVHHRIFPRRRLVTRFLTRGGMPVTMCRLNLVKGLGPALQIAEGFTVDLPEKVHDALDQRTNPTWPTTWFAPNLTGQGAFRDVYSVMNNWGANHGAISYGHIGADLISLAAMLRIPVYMHNVANDKIFRPSTLGGVRHAMSGKRGLSRVRKFRPALRLSVFFRPNRKFIFRAAVALFLLAVAAVLLAYFNPQKFLCVDSGNVSADVMVVLGGGAHERPERAAELFKLHAAPRILVSGAGDAGFNRRILIANGVPASAIEIEDKSLTTRENAEFSIKRLRAEKVRSAIVVTSWYHSRRALATFEHYAPEIKFYSRPSYFEFVRKDWSRVTVKRVYLEFLKLPGYWICYGVDPF